MSDTHLPVLTLAQAAALPPAATVVVTVNNRLARRLAQELSAQYALPGAFAEVLPWRAWFDALAESLGFVAETALPRHRLDDFAARLLWRQAIAASDANLLDTHEAARLAAEADQLMQEWDVHVADQSHEEYSRFSGWRERYLALLAECDADDPPRRLARLLRHLHGPGPGLRLPANIVLAGLREISPHQRKLLDALAEHGCTLYELDHQSGTAPQVQCRAMADRGAEWRAAVAWARSQLERRPDGRYAIVALNLQDTAPFARRILHTRLSGHPFNMSVGRPLTEWPLVQAALAWLKLLAAAPPYAVPLAAGALLAGHCAGHTAEMPARARLDAEWRWRRQTRLPEAHWLRTLKTCPLLLDGWRAALAAFGEARADRLTPDAWAGRMRQALAALGFPGTGTLDSTAYQVLEAFDELLRRYAALTPAAGPLNADPALRLLERLARETPFQPQRDESARLDVVGVLEAEGERWDAVWILGMTDDVLPAPPAPNPLLPATALAAANAPRTTAARELLYAQELFAALLRCGTEITVSHALLDGERELRASPLIHALPPAPPGTLEEPAPAPPLPLEKLDADPGVPLPHDTPLAGGTALLEAQSRNPLWAYARYRLGARELPAYATQAAMPAIRGNFLHLAMQTLWLRLEHSRGLAQALADASLPEYLEHALAVAATQELAELPPALRQLEQDRAREVLAQWLRMESQRTPFHIQHLEGTQLWEHGPLRLTLRLDRVDRLASGGLAILDYKSGSQLDIKGWARERPISLQLPFYAVALDTGGGPAEGGVEALALVGLHAREVAVRGLAGADIGLPDIETPAAAGPEPGGRGRRPGAFDDTDWPGWLLRWRQRIGTLADEFIAGRADNLVLNPNDLKYCDVMPFLRLDLEIDGEEATS